MTEVLAAEIPTIHRARLAVDTHDLARLKLALGKHTTSEMLARNLPFLIRTGSNYILSPPSTLTSLGTTLEAVAPGLADSEKSVFCVAPVEVTEGTEGLVLQCFQLFAINHLRGATVGVLPLLEEIGDKQPIYQNLIQSVSQRRRQYETAMNARAKAESSPSKANFKTSSLDIPQITMTELSGLETLHKVTILYLWLSYRFPLTFNAAEDARNVKAEVEANLNFVLDLVEGATSSSPKPKRSNEGEETRDEEAERKQKERSAKAKATKKAAAAFEKTKLAGYLIRKKAAKHAKANEIPFTFAKFDRTSTKQHTSLSDAVGLDSVF
jgi:hypothetical protein